MFSRKPFLSEFLHHPNIILRLSYENIELPNICGLSDKSKWRPELLFIFLNTPEEMDPPHDRLILISRN